MRSLCFLMASLVFISLPAKAGIYKWVDEQGNVHYSQHKPNTRPVETIQGDFRAPEDRSSYKRPSLGLKDQGASETDATEGAEAPQQGEAAAQPQPQVQAEETKPKMKPKKRKAGCESARRNLATMLSRGQIRRRDQDGNVTYMSEKEKQARIKRTRELIKKNCN